MTDLISAPAFEALDDCQGLTFTVDGTNAELELVEIDTSPDVTEGWVRFTLVFSGDRGAIAGGTHRLVHDSQDPFDVFLSPTSTLVADSKTGHYEAAFARRTPERVRSDLRGREDATSDAGGSGPLGLSAESFIGSVGLFAGSFAPRDFAMCNGASMPVSQQQALFSILGTTYGGNGQTTFDLPDLRGRSPVGVGQAPRLTSHQLGDQGGSESVTLSMSELPSHTHQFQGDLPVSSDGPDTGSPNGHYLATLPRDADEQIYTQGGKSGSMDVDGTVSPTGGGQPHDNRAPYLALNYVICTQGMYPSRP